MAVRASSEPHQISSFVTLRDKRLRHGKNPRAVVEDSLDRVLALLGSDRSLMARAPCGHSYRLSESVLFHGDSIPEPARGLVDKLNADLQALKAGLDKLKNRLANAEQKSVDIQFGKTVEKIVPVLQGFPYVPRDCRPLFDPIDYIAFEGWAERRVGRIDFNDVKSGSAALSGVQV